VQRAFLVAGFVALCEDYGLGVDMRSERLTRWIIGLIFLLLVFAPLFASGVNLLVDWIWFRQEGFDVLYTTVLKTQVALSAWFGLGFLVLVGLNLLIARAISHRAGYHLYTHMIEFPALDRFTAIFRSVVWVGVALVAYFVGEWATGQWLNYLLASHAVHMADADPLFGINLSFYMFRLPFIWFLYHYALAILIACLLSAACLYFVEGGVWITPRGASMARGARAHLMVLGGLLFLVFAYRARLAMYNLLYSPRGVIHGAGYTDVHASLPVLWVMLVVCVLTAASFFAGAKLARIGPAVLSIAALIGVAIVGGAIYPALIQQYIVTPNELAKEEPYIARAIQFTRRAYALDRFHEREFPAREDLTLDAVRANDPTIRNIRLWDHGPLLSTFQQLQEIRTYYDFVRVYNDRYWIHNGDRQVSLSVRELSSSSLPAPNWVNTHLIYTHGYGLCMGPVNESTSDGLPVLFIENIPPVSNIAIKITRPQIYYGELSNNYCVVKTRAKEFDYPSGSDNIYTVYSGSGGIPIHGFWRQVLFALRFHEINLLLSSYIRPTSRIMIYRRVLDRVSRLTPFLAFDSHPYPVISSDGSIYWIVDGYTTSDQYPYSDPTPGLGDYIRNSVKATVSAYNGQVRFYIADPTDPLIQSYARIFPGVFHPISEMPGDLRAHIRYPEDFFSIQADMYATFHMTDPRVFYSREDLWRVASRTVEGQMTPMAPYYTIMKLPEVGKAEEFVLMIPFAPARKNNMIAWMAARCDPPNYGKVLVFAFPKEKLIYGPQQIESRIDQNPGISQQLTLWNQGGSKVIRGTLLVIPVQNSLLYIEPLYLAAQAGAALPELKRVIVAYADHVVMQPTLGEALTEIFGGAVEAPPGLAAPPAVSGQPAQPALKAQKTLMTVKSLIQQANERFQRAQQDLRQGNWSGYGQEIKTLGQLLQQLQAK
jgi:uncharacterized membrane protein (UPF0182 family)